ncbi:MAG: hypothetical protein DHS20C15_23640 [Planctomycetota bacterium]|nr:MAG: hypothetical protein DHS20C15_23640 [Planctomycetota bacterium]
MRSRFTCMLGFTGVCVVVGMCLRSAAAQDDTPVVLAASQIGMSCTPREGGGVACGPASAPGAHPADPTFAHFAEAQQADGSWGPEGAEPSARVGTTALVLWAFTNLGYSLPGPSKWPRGEHPFTDELQRALRFLENAQQLAPDDVDRGRFGARGPDLLAHTFATLAFVDLAGFTGDADLSARANLALDHLVARQSSDGTWPDAGSANTSAWATYALVAAQMRGLPAASTRDIARELARTACRQQVDAALADDASTEPVALAALASLAVLSFVEPASRDEFSKSTLRAFAQRVSRDVVEFGTPEARLWTWLATRTLPGEARDPGLASKLVSQAMKRPACLSPVTEPCEPGSFGGTLDGAALTQVLLGSVLRYESAMGELEAGFP